MPRENRKRGKKHKNQPAEEQVTPVEDTHYDEEEPQAGPSWIVPASSHRDAPEQNPEAPFGYVDADVKAYFRTVDVQLREWQENEEQPGEGDEDVDPNESTFFLCLLFSVAYRFSRSHRQYCVRALGIKTGECSSLLRYRR